MEILLVAAIIGFVAWRNSKRRGVVAPAAEIGAVGWTSGSDWRPLRPLARAEARRLVRHPAFLVGSILTPLMLWAALADESSWWRMSCMVALGLVPLGWLTIVASNLLALQPRRAGAEELLAAAPAPQPVRTSAALLGGLVTATFVATLIAGSWTVFWAATNDVLGSPRPAEMGAGVLVVAGAVTVGIGVARWLPNIAFGVLAVIAVSVLQARFFDTTTWPWDLGEAHPARFLGFLAEPTNSGGDAQLEFRPAGWHLLYLAGLIAVMALVALARNGLPRRVLVLGAAAVAVTATAGWAQTRPVSADRVASMVSYLTDPRPHQTCTTDKTMTICAYEPQLDRVPHWRARADAVLALIPAEVAAATLEITDRVPPTVGTNDCSPGPYTDALPASVVNAIDPAAVWRNDGGVHPGTNKFPCGGRSVNELFTAVQVGSWAVGLPPSPHGLDVRCAGAGQSRAVVALWLGGAVTPGGRESLRDIADEHTGAMATFHDWDDPPMFGVEFAVADIELAIELLDRPVDDVAPTILAQWSTLTAADAPSSEVADRFALSSSGAGNRGDGACA